MVPVANLRIEFRNLTEMGFGLEYCRGTLLKVRRYDGPREFRLPTRRLMVRFIVLVEDNSRGCWLILVFVDKIGP